HFNEIFVLHTRTLPTRVEPVSGKLTFVQIPDLDLTKGTQQRGSTTLVVYIYIYRVYVFDLLGTYAVPSLPPCRPLAPFRPHSEKPPAGTMVVCKCRKATKLYCFVHKVPVCGECICFQEHQICVVRAYSEWVIDGEYDWPPTCCMCQAVLDDASDCQTTRLGCLHVIHTSCLVSHIQKFPPNTAPAGYICPACSSPVRLLTTRIFSFSLLNIPKYLGNINRKFSTHYISGGYR
ncbi:Zinc finger protein-like 1, partial [Nymphaea thermarum]